MDTILHCRVTEPNGEGAIPKPVIQASVLCDANPGDVSTGQKKTLVGKPAVAPRRHPSLKRGAGCATALVFLILIL